jgi:DNA polymerase-3 subunit delta
MRPGFSILVSPDKELIKLRIEQMLANDGARWDRTAYFGDEEIPPAFWQDLQSQGLMGGNKAVVLHRANTRPIDTMRQLSTVLGSIPDTVWPFLCFEGQWSKKQYAPPAAVAKLPFWKLADKKGWIWIKPGLAPGDISRHLEGWAARRSIAIDSSVFDRLAAMLPSDGAALKNELDKLELAAGPDKRLDAQAMEVVADSGELDFFALLNAVRDGRDPARVWRQILGHDAASDMLFRLIAHLHREAGQLHAVAVGEAGEMKINPYALRHKEAALRAIGQANIHRLLDLALEAELGVKSGERTETQAFERLMAGLFELFAPKGRGRPARR